MINYLRLLTALVATFLFIPICHLHLFAQNSTEAGQKQKKRPTVFWPDGVEFDESIPTPREHFGFDVGMRHLRHDQIVSYLEKLAEASGRLKLQRYGMTHGRRPLMLATITSTKNQRNIDRIRAQHRKLTKPGNTVDISKIPIVINMGYGVHGDEPSATNTAPLVAYYLAAAKGKTIEQTLENCIVLLDPSLNPDGFDRFARWANTYRGRTLNPDPAHAEHNQGWPSGRVNYYWFDLNRDWLPLVHPESQSRMNWYHRWKPNVVLDFHEMGTNSTFFFQPGVPKRRNPLTPLKNVELTAEIGNFHAKAFDRRKTPYFTEEVFDDFYMGKGSTYPDLHGAIGILFEQASSRGQVQESVNGLLRFPDTIRNQFTASLSSLEAVTAMRVKLLRYSRDFYARSMELAKAEKTKTYVFTAAGNRERLQQFARLLRQHDIQSYWPKKSLRYGKKKFDKRFSLVVPVEQPEYRFIRCLFDRATKFEENVFYDVSAWTLPLAYNLRQHELETEFDKKDLLANGKDRAPAANLKFADDDVAYLIDCRNDQTPKWLYRLLNANIIVKVARQPFEIKKGKRNRKFGYGTLLVPLGGVQKNKSAAIQRILSLAAAEGVSITPVKSGLTPIGIDLGSSNFATIKKPQVALLTGSSVSSYGAGALWHLLDTKTNMPLTMLKNRRFSNAKLSRYTTLIIPSGRYSFDEKTVENLSNWCKRGGTLITVGSACESVGNILIKPDRKPTDVAVDDRSGEEKDPVRSKGPAQTDSEETEPDPIQKPFGEARKEIALQLISGAIFNAKIDRTHPLFYGFPSELLPVFRTHTRKLEPSKSPYANPLVYTSNPLLGGYGSEKNLKQLGGSPGVVVHRLGSGRVIMLTDHPNFRGFWVGTQRLFLNAIFYGPLTDPPAPRN